MFLSLHVKFIWFQVVLMLDIGSRHTLVSINFVELGSLLFEVTENFRFFLEEAIFLGKCSKAVLQGSKAPGLQYVMLVRSSQGTLQCGPVNGLRKIL